MAKIAIIGSTGFIGSAIVKAAKSRNHETIKINRNNCNLYDLAQLTNKLKFSNSDWVINAAGYTGKPNVDACENEKVECIQANVTLPGLIAKACQIANIPWGHIGSGCIYQGNNNGKGFSEEDPPNFSFRTNNCSFYSGTKALSEEILESYQCYIWRVRIPFNYKPSNRNYISKLLRYDTLLQAENSFSHLDEFARAAIESFELSIPYGIYNVTQPGALTTTQVVEIIKEKGLSDKEFKFFKDNQEFMEKAAITPRSNCVLNVTKAIEAGLTLTPIKTAMERAVENMSQL